MSDSEISFLPYTEAAELVAAIQEEEDVRRPNHRILTVYNHDDKELCWYDFEEVLAAVGEVPRENLKEAVQDYVLHHLPDWAKDV